MTGSAAVTRVMHTIALVHAGARGAAGDSAGAKRPPGGKPPDPRPVDAAEPAAARGRSAEAKSASTLRPPPAWESPVKLEIPTGSWKTLRVYHSVHRPYYEKFRKAEETPSSRLPTGLERRRATYGRRRAFRPSGDDKAVSRAAHRPAKATAPPPLGPATRSATM